MRSSSALCLESAAAVRKGGAAPLSLSLLPSLRKGVVSLSQSVSETAVGLLLKVNS